MSITSLNVLRYTLLTAVLLVGALLALPQSATAAYNIPAAGTNLEGFAWSSTVGWISFNCNLTGSCGTANYSVNLANNGSLTGYAWSSNIGWIKFGGLSGFPTGAGVLSTNAQATGGDFNGNLNFGGWARACAVFVDPNTCSGALDVNAGGWDGWIALGTDSAAPVAYGLTMTQSGATASSYAWGGPIVMGWIDFSPEGYAPVAYEGVDPVISSFDAVPDDILSGNSTDLVFEATDARRCEIVDDLGAVIYDEAVSNPTGQITVATGQLNSDRTFTLTCRNSARSSTDDTLVTVSPDLQVSNHGISAVGQDSGTGVYSEVRVGFDIVGSSYTGTSFDYQVRLLDGATEIDSVTLSIVDDLASINALAPVVFNDISFLADASYEITVDLNDDITEFDETNNTVTGTGDLSAPNPEITIEVDSVVRTGTEAEVTITITSVGGSVCSVIGPGLTGTSINVPAGTTVQQILSTDALTNSTNIVVECSVVGGVPYREVAPVEVTPTFQEV